MLFKTDASLIAQPLAHVNVAGNFTPESWYAHLRYRDKEGEKVDLTAITLLSEIFWQYRPLEVRDRLKTRYITKFSTPLPSFSYAHFTEKFGISMRQAKRALKRLEDRNLVHRIVANSPDNEGSTLYIWLNFHEINRITPGLNIPQELLNCFPQTVSEFMQGIMDYDPPDYWSTSYPPVLIDGAKQRESLQNLGITLSITQPSATSPLSDTGGGGPILDGGGGPILDGPTSIIDVKPQIGERTPLPPISSSRKSTHGDNLPGRGEERRGDLEGGGGTAPQPSLLADKIVALLMDPEVGIQSRHLAIQIAKNFDSIHEVYAILDEWMFDHTAKHIGSLIHRLKHPGTFMGTLPENIDTRLILWHTHILPLCSQNDLQIHYPGFVPISKKVDYANADEQDASPTADDKCPTPRAHARIDSQHPLFRLVQQLIRSASMQMAETIKLLDSEDATMEGGRMILYLASYRYWQEIQEQHPTRFDRFLQSFGLHSIIFADPATRSQAHASEGSFHEIISAS